MAPLVLVLVLPVAVGFVGVTALWPASRRPDAAVLLKLCLALGLGLGVASCSYFLWLLLAGSAGRGLWVAEAVAGVALLAGFAAAMMRYRRPVADLPPRPLFRSKLGLALTAVFAVAVAGQAARVVMYNSLFPHGLADSYLMWNLKARFLHRGGEDWRLIFAFPPTSDEQILAPADYPLLIPATVARAWLARGAETTTEPAVVALAFALACSLLMYAGVTAVRGRSQGALAGIVLAASPAFASLAGGQFVDVPLAFYVLAGLVLFALRDAHPAAGRGWVVLAGATAGLAAWTKNEGWLFLVAVGAARFAVVVVRDGFRAWVREAAAFLLGLLPFLCLLLYYRLHLVPTNYLLAGQGGPTTWDKLSDPTRYKRVFGALFFQLFPGHPGHRTQIGYFLLAMPLYALLLGRGPAAARRLATTPFLVLLLMLAGYVLVYLTTPLDLGGHLYSSLPRVLMHVWPVGLFAFFLWVATPEEAAGREEVEIPASGGRESC